MKPLHECQEIIDSHHKMWVDQVKKLIAINNIKQEELYPWIACSERMPPTDEWVQARLEHHGAGRVDYRTCKYIPSKTVEEDGEFSEYDDETDTCYLPEGWYEMAHINDEYHSWLVSDATITHWHPIPTL